jgi:DNA-binding Xre family transcriptional regulator
MDRQAESAEETPAIAVDLESLLAAWRLVHPHAPRLTMHRLSERIEVSENTLSGLRTGQRRNIDRRILARICWFFECQPAAVLRLPSDGPLALDAVVGYEPRADQPGTIHSLVQTILDQRRLSIHAGAALCGISYPTFRRWTLNSAQSYNLDHLARACHTLAVGINDLLRYETMTM